MALADVLKEREAALKTLLDSRVRMHCGPMGS